ncbi:coagulation factor V isoform X2 [Gadus macrocephalus]|uniref:coagulation factor V isoform X2 n=1 Tax=Gadus macrocephalus TaxID=80720 RepID=UPI0028CB80CF|nr:coagulation factor V isoform X2 [Gadus macrocephalus]
MRLCSWAGPQCFVPFLVLLAVLPHVTADQDNPKERHYYVAAVEIDWNYLGKDSRGNDSTYKKVVFREYERDFKQPKTHPTWLGLLGPTLRAQEGETIVVTFRNMADREYSLHPHGIAYGKQSEGAPYFDNTSLKEKEDDVVRPGGEHTYYWEVTSAVAPQKADPACLTYTYVSHLNVVKDYNSGLIGTLLLCKPGSLNEFGEQVHFPQEYVFLFGVFDEKESWFTPAGHSSSNHVMHTINGYAAGSLPDVDICAHSSVSLHLVGMSSEQELFSVHMNGQVLQHRGHKMSTVGLVSGSATTGSMRAVHPGRWLLSSQTNKHMEAGMHGFVDVRTCKGFEAHRRRLTIEQQRHSKEWTYYIAAEEIMWNYAPKMPAYIDEDFKVNYLDQGNHRIGGIYKKAVYTQYTDETFTVRSEEKQRKAEVGILGPVIRAQIRDVIKVVFKNMASKPYSIYPHGLTIEKSQEGATYPEGGNQTHAVQPGQTHHYEWKVVDEDEPLDTDARCLTYLYHSAVDTPRDIASGLIGPLLICKSQSLNVRNVQLKADKEQHAMFMVFDENKSWYLDDNIQSTCGGETVNKAEPGFYKSNVMHTINGYVFESGQLLGFCNGEIATWHVSSVGAQDYIQSVTFYGHTFNLNDRTEDILGLYPMTGETIFMNMDNIGVWLLATLNSHGSTKGMRVRFQDVECYRDYEYEYTDYNEPNKEFAVWKPATLAEIDKEDELKKKQEMEEKKEAVVDSYTDYYAGLLGLRSLKKQSSDSDVEQIDFSLLDFDAVDVPEQDSKTFSGIQTTTTKTDMEKSNIMKEPDSIPMSQNETLSAQQEIYKTNLTTYILNQSKSETATWMKNSSASIDTNVSRSKDNISTNHSMPTNLLPINSTFIPETAHAILNNTTIPLISGATNISMTSKTNVSYTFKAEGINSTQTMGNKTSERIIQTENILEVFSYVVPPQGPTSNGTNEMVRLDIEDQTGSALIGESEIERGGQQGPFGDGINATVLPEINASFINDTDTFYNVTQLTKDILSNVSEEAISEEMHNHTRRKVDRLVMNMTKPFGDGINATVLPEINASSINDTDTFYKLTQLTKDILSNVIEEAIGYAFFSKKKMHKPTKSMVEIKVEDTMNMTKTNDSMHTVTKTENVRTYFISAEEVEWDYAGYGQRRPEKTLQTRRETKFTKVVFREYLDSTFTTPILRGEMEEHLGILGPLIKAEVGQSIMVVFRNRASRPYSMHPNGVTYTKLTEGLSYEDDSKYWYKFDNEVQPNTTFTYLWEVREMAGPMPGESSCRTWAYYSGVNPERDLHSGLIGPLLVCRKDTLNTKLVDVREFVLLFMTFDESQSWYYEKNSEMRRRRKSRVGGRTLDPNLKEKLRFHSINGIIFSLKGLRLYTKQLACWHLINMGSPKDVHTVHFHGQTFTQMNTNSYRQAVYPLLPGGFATLEMWPSKPGLWQLDTEVGAIQQKGMQTLFLVLDNECSNPLGLESGSVKDSQITSNHVRGYWEPHLARLNKQGKYNAWSTDEDNSWIQVDFLRPVVISQVATQGAKQMFHSQYVVNYTISYSTDRRSWIFFKGDSPSFRKNFPGNNDANGVEKQILFPPLIGRYVRFHPNHWYKRATVRMEMYGCELDGCSVPLGMEGGLIKDHQITASSRATSWFGGPWNPSLARLNLQGTVNAWQALNADMNQWLQIELTEVKKITGIITQGAKSMGKEMYVVSFTLEYSEDGVRWTQYTDDEEYTSRRFIGNTDNNGPVRNYIYPPIFSRFIRVIPTSWKSSITMRMELLGCDFE